MHRDINENNFKSQFVFLRAFQNKLSSDHMTILLAYNMLFSQQFLDLYIIPYLTTLLVFYT